MENKISASTIAAMVALTTGQPGELCEKFIKELLSLICDTLAAGENVRIKGLGTFKIVDIETRKSVDVASGGDIEIPAHCRVIFVPCKVLASLVNTPFEAFEAEEVADDLPTDELMLDPDDTDSEEYQDIDEALQEEEDDSEASDDYPDFSQCDFNIIRRDTNMAEAGGVDEKNVPEVTSEFSDGNSKAADENTDVAKEWREEEPARGEPIIISFSSPQQGRQNFEVKTPSQAEDATDSNEITESADQEDGETSYNKLVAEDPKGKIDSNSGISNSDDPETAGLSSETIDSIKPDSGEADIEEVNPNKPEAEESDSDESGEWYEESDSSDADSDRRRRGGRFVRGFLVGFLTAAAVVVILFIAGMKYGYIRSDHFDVPMSGGREVVDNRVEAPQALPVVTPDTLSSSEEGDSAYMADTSDVPTRPSDVTTRLSDEPKSTATPSGQPVYDTVSTTRYLTTMAQEHYGNYNLWPVIYKENQAILGHPDRIKPGTKVVVPPLSKYNINPANPDDVSAMKREGVKIYSKFKKKN